VTPHRATADGDASARVAGPGDLGLYPEDVILQHRQILDHHSPDLLHVQAKVLVNEDVPQGNQFGPRRLG